MIAVCLILCWTLFGLSAVEVSFDSTTKKLILNESEIVEAGEFRYGACVLFEGKKASIQKIEQACEKNENFAYLRVKNIETVFPNKFVVHVEEREELFAVECEDKFLLCDRDLRVLDVLDEFSSTAENAILLKGLQIKNFDIKIGDFLNVEQNAIKKFYSYMIESNRSLSEQIGKFKQIELQTYVDPNNNKEYVSLVLKTFQNRDFVINNIDFAFSAKVNKMFSVETAIYSQNIDEEGNILTAKGEKIYVKKTTLGELIPFNEGDDESLKITLNINLLNDYYIKIDNLTLSEYVERTEKDIYYSFVEKS